MDEERKESTAEEHADGDAVEETPREEATGTDAASENAAGTADESGEKAIPVEGAEAPATGERPDAGETGGGKPAAETNEDAAPDGAATAAAGDVPAPEEPVNPNMRWYVLHTYSGREAKVRDTIERLIRNSDFQDKFGIDIRERFAGPLDDLQNQGLLSVDDGVLRLNRDGLLQVDRLLHQFFLPEHQGARYA